MTRRTGRAAGRLPERARRLRARFGLVGRRPGQGAWLGLVLWAALALGGCAASTEIPDQGFRAPVQRELPVDPAGPSGLFYVNDPWEPFNRRMYDFNAQFDRYVYLPVVRAYEYVTPVLVQRGVSNVLDNLKEPLTFANCVLQGNLEKAGVAVARLVLNSTCGFLGLLDVATPAGLDRQPEDFGQTLGVWGVSSGPYLVLPVLGPSNVRDTAGLVVDGAGSVYEMSLLLEPIDPQTRTVVSDVQVALEAVDARHRLRFSYYQTGSPFEYALVRFLFMKKRSLDVLK